MVRQAMILPSLCCRRYDRMKDKSQGFKHVAINDEMTGTNLTVVHMLHEFYLALMPTPSSFERSDCPFEPRPLPSTPGI
eukprot:COSAG05_NODE_1041_length_6067_cov_116.470845_2_plen_79_part_00